MRIDFDYLKQARKPKLMLCQPNGTELYSVALATNKRLNLNSNGVDTLSFEVHKIQDHLKMPYYGLLKNDMVISVENFGKFIIKKVNTTGDGVEEVKKINCFSLEFEIATKSLSIDGTYPFYNNSSNEDTIMSIIMSYLGDWKIGSIDSELWLTKRFFECNEVSVYNFMMEEVQKAYDCVFIFDTFNKTISAKTIKNYIKDKDIFMSYRNLVKETSIEEDSEHITTALDVWGDGDLSIHIVNPTGGTLYDFTYYKNFVDETSGIGYMSDDLKNAITLWETKTSNNTKIFSNLLTQIKQHNQEIINYNTQLEELNTQLKSLNQEKGMAIANNEDTTDVNNRISAKESEIANKKILINTLQETINRENKQREDILKDCDIKNNFTDKQWSELLPFIKQQKVQYTEFSKTELTTVVEEQELMEELRDYGKEQLTKSCKPTYQANLSVIGFLGLIKYRKIINDLELGDKVIVEIDRKKDLFLTLVLIGMEIDLDNFEDLSLKFSSEVFTNSMTPKWQNLFNETAHLSTSYNFESYNRRKNKNVRDDFNDYKNNALSLANQEIVSSTNIGIDIGDYGMRCRKWLEEINDYSHNQLWITTNVIAFSQNGFNGVPSMAIGEVTMPDGAKGYGVVADSLVGNMVFTKYLNCKNESGSFVVDGGDVHIRNGDIVITNDEGKDETIQDLFGNVYDSMEKYNNVLTPDGWLDTDKMQGKINGGKNNIILEDVATGKCVRMNSNGIGVANKRNAQGEYIWVTAITGDGVVANIIQANAQINSPIINGGTITGANFISNVPNTTRKMELSGGSIDFIDTSQGGTLASLDQSRLQLYAEGSSSNSISITAKDTMGGTTGMKVIAQGEDDFELSNLNSGSNLTLGKNGNTYINAGRGGSGDIYIQPSTSSRHTYLLGSAEVSKDFKVLGDKNSIVPTQHYGTRALYAEECDRVYFGTKGIAETNNKECVISLDPIFMETIELNSSYPYIITLTSYSDAKVWVNSVDDDKFIVESDKDTKFSYSLKAIRISYGKVYLKEKRKLSNKELKELQETAINRMITG